MFMLQPRRKFTRVMLNERAVSMARLVGPEMAHTIGMPATADFCRISNEVCSNWFPRPGLA